MMITFPKFYTDVECKFELLQWILKHSVEIQVNFCQSLLVNLSKSNLCLEILFQLGIYLCCWCDEQEL